MDTLADVCNEEAHLHVDGLLPSSVLAACSAFSTCCYSISFNFVSSQHPLSFNFVSTRSPLTLSAPAPSTGDEGVGIHYNYYGKDGHEDAFLL
jgi:hypothetical protein